MECNTNGSCVCNEGYTGPGCFDCANGFNKDDSGSCQVGTKVLVATGAGASASEVIDLEDPSFDCTGVQDFPVNWNHATGGMVEDVPLVCKESCYTLQPNGAWKHEQSLTLTQETSYAAYGSVVINDELVVVQGRDIQLVSPKTGSRTLSARLPRTLNRPCIVKWNDSTVFVSGGYSGSTRRETFFVNIVEDTITNGPDLQNGRYAHGCNEIVINNVPYIVVTGGWNPHAHKSTEILSKEDYTNGWQRSADIPVKLADAQIVASPNKDELFTFGNNYDSNNKDIYRFSCQGNSDSCSWTKTNLQLKHGREEAVAFAISDGLAEKLCN